MAPRQTPDPWEVLLRQKVERNRRERIAWAVTITIWLLALVAFFWLTWAS